MSTRKLHITLEQLPTGEYRAECLLPGWQRPMRSGDYEEIDGALGSMARQLIHYRDGLAAGQRRRALEASIAPEVKALPAGDDVDWEWML